MARLTVAGPAAPLRRPQRVAGRGDPAFELHEGLLALRIEQTVVKGGGAIDPKENETDGRMKSSFHRPSPRSIRRPTLSQFSTPCDILLDPGASATVNKVPCRPTRRGDSTVERR
ncbi:MAG: hypothetical protein ICV73_13580 [Acetobacteraceae bacterium]|nr:hypothetical protein [Acetobacteraceae bacterium]